MACHACVAPCVLRQQPQLVSLGALALLSSCVVVVVVEDRRGRKRRGLRRLRLLHSGGTGGTRARDVAAVQQTGRACAQRVSCMRGLRLMPRALSRVRSMTACSRTAEGGQAMHAHDSMPGCCVEVVWERPVERSAVRVTPPHPVAAVCLTAVLLLAVGLLASGMFRCHTHTHI